MPTNPERLLARGTHPLFGELEKNWGWMLAVGIGSILLGMIGLTMTFAFTLATIVFFGVLFVVAGTLHLIDALKCRGWKGIATHVLIALLYISAGLVIVVDPVLASQTLTLIIAALLIAVGGVRLLMALQHRGVKAWRWTLISALISIILGVMIFAQWPFSGAWVIGLFVAIELVFSGWAYVVVALTARNATRQRPDSDTDDNIVA